MDQARQQRADGSRWEQVKEVLEGASDLSGTERATFVREAFPDEPELVREVLSLLEADRDPPRVLRELDAALEDIGGAPEEVTGEAVDPLGPSSLIGPYRLVERIGEGGMGDVWLAEQTHPLRRRVAVKILRLGMDTRKVVARFEQERQALALMDHPNIARVYDGGATPTGRPYFVMELVTGRPIDEYADADRLDTRSRLRLFLEVCRAVQHAHQKGVIHRDLKPSNLLVRQQEGRPMVKVIDFGISKALGPSLVEESFHTRIGQVVGTPDYMSPEQADPESRDVDTRADIYSLGVVLYELLTGSRPYRVQRHLDFALAHRLRDAKTVPPSALVTRSDTQKTVAHFRSTTVAALRRELAGDLDWIVMKAIDKDRSRRYATVNELAQEVERYLRSEPVLARPPSVTYRASRFVRRHRAGTVAAAVALLALVGGGTVAAFGWAAAADEARVATARELAASSIVQLDRDPELSLLLALEAARLAPLPQAEDALDRALDSGILTTLEHSDGVVDAALSGDGRRVLVATRDGTVTVRDLESEATLLTLTGHLANRVAFSADDRRFATADTDGGVRVWNVGTGALVTELGGHEGYATDVAFDPAGSRLVSSGQDGVARIWDLETGAAWTALEGHDGPVDAVAWDPRGERVATGGRDMTVRLWSARTGELVLTIPPPPGTLPDRPNRRASVLALAFDADGGRLVSGGTNGVRVWDAATGTEIWSRAELTPYDVALDRDGERVAVAGYDRLGRVFHVRSGTELATLTGHTDYLRSISFTPDGERVVTHAMDGTTRVWKASDGAVRRVVRDHDREVMRIAYSPDGRHLATASLDGTAKVRELPSGEVVGVFRHEGPVTDVAFGPGGGRVVTVGTDGRVALWDVATGADVTSWEAGLGPVMAVALSPDGRTLATGGATLAMRSAEPDGPGRVLWEVPLRGTRTLAFGGGGRLLVAGDGPTAVVFDAATGDSLRALVGHGRPIRDVAVAPDGVTVGTASEDGTARLWDVTTGEQLRTLRGHRERLYGIAFSPDGLRVATGSGGGAAKIWDVGSGTEIVTLDRSRGLVIFDVAFRPDGGEVATASEDGVALFPHTIGELVAAAQARVDRSLIDEECRRYLHREACR